MPYPYDDTPEEQPYSFWNPAPGSQPEIIPNTAPTINFQGTSEAAVPGQPGMYSPSAGGTASNPFFPNGTFNGDYQGYFNALFPGPTLTGADLKAKEAELAKAGLKLKTSASGNTAWVVLPDGREVDVIEDYGGLNKKQWMVGGGGGPRPQVDTSGLLNSSVIAPFLGTVPNPGLPKPFSFEKFRPTTAADVFADPSYDFRFTQGERGVMQNRISRGLAKTGGTLKALDRYGQDFASTEFGNIDSRRYRDYVSGYGQDREAYDLNSVNPNQTEYSRGLTKFLQDKDSYYKNSQIAFDRPLAVARLGYDANA